MDAGDKKNNTGEQVHLSSRKNDIEMKLRRGSWSAGFTTKKILSGFLGPRKSMIFAETGKRFWL